jgi:hypothetical protein
MIAKNCVSGDELRGVLIGTQHVASSAAHATARRWNNDQAVLLDMKAAQHF